MRRALISFMSIVFLLFVMTYAGMAIFAAQGVMTDAAHHGPVAMGLDCLDRCLSAVAPFTGAFSPLFVTAFSFVAFIMTFVATTPNVGVVRFSAHRWREGIGKTLVRQELSTIILRN